MVPCGLWISKPIIMPKCPWGLAELASSKYWSLTKLPMRLKRVSCRAKTWIPMSKSCWRMAAWRATPCRPWCTLSAPLRVRTLRVASPSLTWPWVEMLVGAEIGNTLSEGTVEGRAGRTNLRWSQSSFTSERKGNQAHERSEIKSLRWIHARSASIKGCPRPAWPASTSTISLPGSPEWP